MRFQNVALAASAYHLSDNVVSSETIEARLAPVYEKLKLPQGRLELMTGIKERRVWPLGTRPSTLASVAAEKLFETSHYKKEEVDLLIHASVCRDFLEPATASVVHANLGLREDCTIFDLSNACLGVMNGFVQAASMIEGGLIKCALIVSGENGGPLLEETIEHLLNDQGLTRKSIKKFFANLTIGGAAVAWLLTRSDDAPSAPRLLGGATKADSSANRLCQGDGNTNGLMMETDSEELMKAGVALARKTCHSSLGELEWDREQIDWVIGHQVGQAHELMTLEARAMTDKKTFVTYDQLGNTGSAALPVTLAMLLEQKERPRPGERMLLMGIGSGLSCLMLGVEF